MYDKKEKEWRLRKRGAPSVGRVHQINPVAGDVYYLRVLLHDDHSSGKTSFEDMLTLPDGRVCETYKQVCLELGLLDDDAEWHGLFESLALTSLCHQLRETFVIVIMFENPADPLALFEEFWPTWCDDIEHKHRQNTGEDLTEAQKKTLVLLDLELELQSHEKQLSDYGLPVPTPAELEDVQNVRSVHSGVAREELDYEVQVETDLVAVQQPTFLAEQQDIFHTAIASVQSKEQLLMFIDATGGCGKTYLLNTILSAVRIMDGGSTALAMATTGIAANLLRLGRTFHSRLKAPLTPTEESTLQISAQSDLAQLVSDCKIMMIDEATMLDRYLLEALDRTLKDLMDVEGPFGGKTLILAGDFGQCLPVVKGASKSDTVRRCINQSLLWRHFRVMQLSVNMRVHRDRLNS